MGKTLKAVAGVAVAVGIAALAVPTGGLSVGLASFLSVSAGVASSIATVALGTIASLAFKAIAGKPSSALPAPLNFRQSISNSFIIIGKRRAGGQMVFFHPRETGGDHFRYFVIACAGHRCKGVTKWYLADDEVTVDGAGMVTSGPYANNAWLWFQRGTATEAANATFVAECGGKWTANHRGRGVAAIYAKFEMTDDVIEAGMPTISAEVEGADEIRDPRDDTTKYTNLATPAFYWWLQLPREEGGFGASPDEVPDDVLLSAWTNICDEDVPLDAGGTEKRYTFDSVIETGATPSQIRETFKICHAASFTYSSGKFLMRPGYWVLPSATLLEKDLTGEIRIPLLSDSEQFATEVSGTFFDPNNLYQPQPVPTRSVVADEVRQADFELPHITSHTRAQRILEIMLRRAQAEKRVTWPMNIVGLEITAMQTVQLATSRFGLSNYAFVVDGWSLASDFGVTLNHREENADIYDWEIADELPLASAGTLDSAIPVSPSIGFASSAGAVGSYDGGALAALEDRIAALEP